jgi:hypothetical protein
LAELLRPDAGDNERMRQEALDALKDNAITMDEIMRFILMDNHFYYTVCKMAVVVENSVGSGTSNTQSQLVKRLMASLPSYSEVLTMTDIPPIVSLDLITVAMFIEHFWIPKLTNLVSSPGIAKAPAVEALSHARLAVQCIRDLKLQRDFDEFPLPSLMEYVRRKTPPQCRVMRIHEVLPFLIPVVHVVQFMLNSWRVKSITEEVAQQPKGPAHVPRRPSVFQMQFHGKVQKKLNAMMVISNVKRGAVGHLIDANSAKEASGALHDLIDDAIRRRE